MTENIIGSAAANIAPTGVGGTITTLFGWVLAGLVIGGIVYLVWYFFRYKTEVTILQFTGSGVKEKSDRLREVRDKTNKSLITHKLLKNSNDWGGEVPSDYFIQKSTFFGYKEKVYFSRTPKGELQVMKPSQVVDIVKFKSVDASNQKWAAMRTKEMQARYTKTGWWDKHSATVMGAATILIVMVVMVVLIRELGQFSDAVTSGLRNVAESLRLAAESGQAQFIEGGSE